MKVKKNHSPNPCKLHDLEKSLMTGRLINVGPTAALNLGDGNHIIVTFPLHQCQDSEGFKDSSMPFEELEIVTIKSRVHFQFFYETAAREIIEVDAPGLGLADLIQFNYKNEPPGFYPIFYKWRK